MIAGPGLTLSFYVFGPKLSKPAKPASHDVTSDTKFQPVGDDQAIADVLTVNVAGESCVVEKQRMPHGSSWNKSEMGPHQMILEADFLNQIHLLTPSVFLKH